MRDPVWLHFSAVWKRLGANGNPRKAYTRLVLRYERPARFYHSLHGHILHCLEELAAAQPFTGHSDRAVAAILYHDAHNDPHDLRVGHNELLSTLSAAREYLAAGLDREFVRGVCSCILASRHWYAPAWIDGKAVVDADLSILGQDEDAFDRYTDQIRQEHIHVPWDVYRVKRAEILSRFLTHEHIYCTPYFRERYEAQARKNIKRALRFLMQ